MSKVCLNFILRIKNKVMSVSLLMLFYSDGCFK
jgi:hypothetical protein